MRKKYQKPQIIDERELETHALACGKVPGYGDPNYCGSVYANPTGNQSGCYMNPSSRSS